MVVLVWSLGLLTVGSAVSAAAPVGAWGTFNELSNTPDGGGQLSSVSCTGASDCTAVGWDSSTQPITVTETNGVWGAPANLPAAPNGGSGYLFGVSCTGAGDCTAVGADAYGQAISVTETAGTWATPVEIPGSPAGGTELAAVSCGAAGYCTAVGVDRAGQPISAAETAGTWAAPVEISGSPGGGAQLMAVSCTDATDCTAVGQDNNGAGEPLYVTETAGTWATPTEVASTPAGGNLTAVDCSSPADCTAVGYNLSGPAMELRETGGTWGAPVEQSNAPGDDLSGISCADATDCTAVGMDSNSQPAYVTEVTPPTVTAGASTTYEASGSPVVVDPGLAVSGPTATDLVGATVSLGAGLAPGDILGFSAQSGISGRYDPTTGALTLSGPASAAAYQAVLESVTYSSSAQDPTSGGSDPSRTITWQVNDGLATSAPATSTLNEVVGRPPTITSPSTVYLPWLASGSVTLTATGTPTPTLSEAGSLPYGLRFTADGNGTATISGRAGLFALGRHDITLTATNGVGSPVTQTLSVVVGVAPVLLTPPRLDFRAGRPNAFRLLTLADPTATITESGSLPSWLTFDAHPNGTATLAGTPPPGAGGQYAVTLTASNGVGSMTRPLTVTVGRWRDR